MSNLHPEPFFFPGQRGTFNFVPTHTAEASVPGSGNAFADFLLGLATTASVGVGDAAVYGEAWRTGLYVQDDWRLGPKLTLNLGLRYEFLTPVVEKFDRFSTLDLDTGNFIIPCTNGRPSPKADFAAFSNLTFVCNETDFGAIFSSRDARVVQLGLKYVF